MSVTIYSSQFYILLCKVLIMVYQNYTHCGLFPLSNVFKLMQQIQHYVPGAGLASVFRLASIIQYHIIISTDL